MQKEDYAILGRSKHDIEKYGDKGTAYIGKVLISGGDSPVMGKKILIDFAKPHLILVCGKRGGGKSYTMSVLMEAISKMDFSIKSRVSLIVIDTVGIFWTLKYKSKKEFEEWGIKPEGINVKVSIPQGIEEFYKEKKIPYDDVFSLKASELGGDEWMELFGLNWRDPEGIVLNSAIEEVREKLGSYYGIKEIISGIEKQNGEEKTKQSLIARIKNIERQGFVTKQGTKINDLAKAGEIRIIDVSGFKQTMGMESIKEIVIAVIGKKLFEQRMIYRKEEEINFIQGKGRTSGLPLVWLFIDEAHMFLPSDRKSISRNVLLEWVRVGRQPGLGLLLATQRPNKLHPDAISQCDLFISHRLTSNKDIEAVGEISPTYLRYPLRHYYEKMPREQGYALIIDDQTENIWMIRVRPRMTWDGGKTASAFLR